MRRPPMSAFSPMSSARKRTATGAILTGLFCAGAAFGTAQGQGVSRQDASIPNFAPSSAMGWLKAGVGDAFLPPDTGPGPVVAATTQSFGSNFLLTPGNPRPYRIADLKNPILHPWVVEKMRKANEEVLAGKV